MELQWNWKKWSVLEFATVTPPHSHVNIFMTSCSILWLHDHNLLSSQLASNNWSYQRKPVLLNNRSKNNGKIGSGHMMSCLISTLLNAQKSCPNCDHKLRTPVDKVNNRLFSAFTHLFLKCSHFHAGMDLSLEGNIKRINIWPQHENLQRRAYLHLPPQILVKIRPFFRFSWIISYG